MGHSRFVARQPIFDRHQNVCAYELLFRSGFENFYVHADGDAASRTVMDNFFFVGMETLTEGRKAFINCTREVLVKGLASLLPRQRVVLEILEGIEPDVEVVDACQRLKQDGYTIALDDFTEPIRCGALVELADIIKVDFSLAEDETRTALVRDLARPGLSFLAEKVETQDDFNLARTIGYEYAQGYFFSRPQVVSSRDVPSFKLNYLRILQEVSQPDLELGRIETLIKQEASLCFKLLRYLNSALFGFVGEVKTIHHALRLLGERDLRRWVSVVAIETMAQDKPAELVVSCLVRARFAELLAPHAGLEPHRENLFLMGLLSLMGAILDQPMASILHHLPVSKPVKSALLENRGPLSPVYQLILAQETADWNAVARIASELRLSDQKVTDAYLASVAWVQSIFRAA